MTILPTAPTRDEVAAASVELDNAAGRILYVEAQVAELRQRRTTLEAVIAQHQAAQPNTTISYDPAMVDALAADPTAGIDAGAVAAKLAGEREAHRLWGEQDGLYREALAKIDGEIAAKLAEIATLQAERVKVWRNFVLVAHAYLLGEFAAAMDRLNIDVLDPLAMLAAVEIDGTAVIDIRVPRIDQASAIKFEHTPLGHRQFTDEEVAARAAALEQGRFNEAKAAGMDMTGKTPRDFPGAADWNNPMTGGGLREEVIYPRVTKRGAARPAAWGSIEKFRATLKE